MFFALSSPYKKSSFANKIIIFPGRDFFCRNFRSYFYENTEYLEQKWVKCLRMIQAQRIYCRQTGDLFWILILHWSVFFYHFFYLLQFYIYTNCYCNSTVWKCCCIKEKKDINMRLRVCLRLFFRRIFPLLLYKLYCIIYTAYCIPYRS